MRSIYKAIMDPDSNPLSALPPAQRFQLMVSLSVMWTIIFCTAAGSWMWFGHLMGAHVLVALGFAVTGWTFYRANTVKTYRDYPLADGTARYDDVWGGA